MRRWLAGLLIVGTMQAASAAECLHLEAEALYWKPFDSSLYLGNLITTSTVVGNTVEVSSTHFNLNPDYGWGARIRGCYSFPCSPLFVGVAYTYLRCTGRVNFDFDQFQQPDTTDLFAGTYISRDRFHHQVFDLLGGVMLVDRCRVQASIFAGGRYLYAKHTFDSNYTSEGANRAFEDRGELRFSGGGPLLGLQGYLCIWRGLQLSLQFSSSATIGARMGELDHETFTGDGTLLEIDSFFYRDTIIVPSLGGEVALSYNVQLGGSCVSIMAGYASHTYFGLLDREVLCLFRAAPPGKQNITLAGPYFGVGVVF